MPHTSCTVGRTEVVDRPVEGEVIKTVRQVEYVDMPIQPRGAQWVAPP